MVTGANDTLADSEKVARWMLDELGDDVPLHYVRFHPAFQYTAVGRTDIGVLKAAREQALKMGVKHCYLGNVFETGAWSDTACLKCGAVLVKRFGLRSTTPGLDGEGRCRGCGTKSSVAVGPSGAAVKTSAEVLPHEISRRWSGEIGSGHVEVLNLTDAPQRVLLRRDLRDAEGEVIPLRPRERWRFMASRVRPDSPGVSLRHPDGVRVEFWDVLDRAHFPTAQEMHA
jgi:pyruvate formate lyase activating enzyme